MQDEPEVWSGFSRKMSLKGARVGVQVYRWVERTLVHDEYASLRKPDKGVVKRYVEKMTGLSRAQVTRLIAGYTQTGRVKPPEYERHKFACRYTPHDA